MSKAKPFIVPDFSKLSDEEKNKLITEFGEIAGKSAIRLFISLGLKSHIDFMIINDATGDEYILSFKKITS